MRSQPYGPDFFRGNRKAVLKAMVPGSLGLIGSASPMVRGADQLHPWRQDSDFFYLTGIQQPGCYLLLVPNNQGGSDECLFIPAIDLEKEKWEGPMLTLEQARLISGVMEIRTSEVFLASLFRAQRHREYLYVEINQDFYDQPLTKDHLLLKDLRTRLPGLNFKKLSLLTLPLRSKKQPEEIERLRQSLKIIDQGLRAVMAKLKSGMMEYEIEAELVYHYLKNGCDRLGYEIIAASGKNAACLHYVTNDKKIEAGQMILIDTGGEYGMMSGDITRVYPVSGRFSSRQKFCYNAVLEVNERVIESLKPGQSWQEVSATAGQIMGEVYTKRGFIADPKEYLKVGYHRIGHSLGLDIHDVSMSDAPLEPGAVITVEPGLYLPNEDMGLRIEDNVLFTETGVEVLSRHIPKTTSEIEAIMAQG